MTTPATTVEIYFNGSWVNVSSYVNAASFQRGKTSQLFDAIGPASGSITLNNETRRFDPLYSSGPYYGYIRPGKKVRITTASNITFYGRIADWNLEYDVSRRSIAVARLEDGLAVLGRQQFDAWTSTGGQRTDQRITSVLARGEVSWLDSTSIGTGSSTLDADNVAWGSPVLNYLQLVATSEGGWLYVSRDGVLTFKGRTTSLGTTTAFADDGTGLKYHAIETSFGSETLFNRVSVDSTGTTALTLQTVTTTPVDADDGVRSLSLPTLLADETQLLSYATFLANARASGDVRIAAFTVNLNTAQYTSGQRTTICGLDLTSLASVKFTPNRTGSAITQNCVIEGIAHDISPEQHFVTFYVTNSDGIGLWRLEDPVFGSLNGPGVLSW